MTRIDSVLVARLSLRHGSELTRDWDNTIRVFAKSYGITVGERIQQMMLGSARERVAE